MVDLRTSLPEGEGSDAAGATTALVGVLITLSTQEALVHVPSYREAERVPVGPTDVPADRRGSQ